MVHHGPCLDHVSSGKERRKRFSGVDFKPIKILMNCLNSFASNQLFISGNICSFPFPNPDIFLIHTTSPLLPNTLVFKSIIQHPLLLPFPLSPSLFSIHFPLPHSPSFFPLSLPHIVLIDTTASARISWRPLTRWLFTSTRSNLSASKERRSSTAGRKSVACRRTWWPSKLATYTTPADTSASSPFWGSSMIIVSGIQSHPIIEGTVW